MNPAGCPVPSTSEWMFQDSARENGRHSYDYSMLELPSTSLEMASEPSSPVVVKIEPTESDYDCDMDTIPNPNSVFGVIPSIPVRYVPQPKIWDEEYVELDNKSLVVEVERLDPEIIERYSGNNGRLRNVVKKRGRTKSVSATKIKIKTRKQRQVKDEHDSDSEPDFSEDEYYQIKNHSKHATRRPQLKPLKVRIRLTEKVSGPNPRMSRKKKASSEADSTSIIRRRGRPRKEISSRTEPDDETVPPSDPESSAGEGERMKRKVRKLKKLPASDDEDREEDSPAKKRRRRRRNQSVPNPDDPNPPQIGPCEMCQLKFHTEEELDGHTCKKYYELPNGRFQCGQCDKSLGRKKDMPSHLRIHTGLKPYKCKYCDARFKDHRNRRVHEKSSRHENQRQFKCPHCEKCFTSSAGMLAHVKIHGEKKYFCTFPGCDKGFFQKINLTYHYTRNGHGGDGTGQQSEKWICPICGEGFFKPNHLRHRRRCEAKKAEIEAAAEPYKDLLTIVEHQDGIFTCSLCRLQFRSEFNYVAHDCSKFCKLGENVWRCGICLKIKNITFTEMKHHMKYHTSEKPFKCTQCDKTFRHESERNRHVAAHAGKKTFLCQTCGASYTAKQRFVLHLKAKHPEIPVESVVEVLRRPGGGRRRELERIQRLGAGYTRRKRGPNRKTLLQAPPGDVSRSSTSQPSSVEPDRQIVPIVPPAPPSHPHYAAAINPVSHSHFVAAINPAPVPIMPSSYAQPPPQLPHPQAHFSSTYSAIPPRQILADPRDWNWQWQQQNQSQQPLPPPTTYPTFYPYHSQQPVPPSAMYTHSGPSSSSGSMHVGDDSIEDADSGGAPVDVEVEPDFESMPDASDDWLDETIEDPWETAFDVQKSKKTKRSDGDVPISTTTPREEEKLPKVDGAGLFTKIARKEWLCNVCSKTSNRRSQMVSHCRVHTGSKPFACDECDHKFKDKRNLMIHMRVHSGSKPYQCPVCFVRFRHNAPFNVHKRSHGDLLLTVPPLPKPQLVEKTKKERVKLVKLKQAANVFPLSAQELLDSINDDLPFRCALCIQTYATESEMNEHDCPRFAPLENGWWKCGVCLKSFKRRSEAKGHRSVHQDIFEYVCDQCGKGFKGKRSMTRHQAKVHLGIKKIFHCSICSKEFTTNYNKDIHERKHKQEMPFLCSICAMGFYDKQSYKHHMERHEAGGPTFKCSICSTEVTTKYELCLHSKTHGIMPKYRCRKKVMGPDGVKINVSSRKKKPPPEKSVASKEVPQPKLVPSIKLSIPKQPEQMHEIKEEPCSSESESSGDSYFDNTDSEDESEEDVPFSEQLRLTRSRDQIGS